MSIFSAISIASSTSMPRHLTVLSIFMCADVQKMLGNAVPSLVARRAREIRGQVLRKRLKGKRLKLLPRRKSVPAAGPVTRVPKKFLGLEGNHAEHPGEGKGSRARARRAAIDHRAGGKCDSHGKWKSRT
jgi:hypothetical protein